MNPVQKAIEKLSIPGRKVIGELPQVPWSAVLYELDPRLLRVELPPSTMQVISRQDGRQLVRFAANREFWLPESCNLNEDLWGEYLSVFWSHRVNRHYYFRHLQRFSPNSVVLDCGAFCGFFIRLALEHDAGRIIAIEPNPIMRDCLEATFHRQIEAGTLSFGYGALTQSACQLWFDGAQSAPFGGAAGPSNGGGLKVTGFCLDDYLGSLGLDRLDFVKMDIEGFEIQALLGAGAILQRFKPALSVTTYHRCADFQMLRNWLKTIGYSRIQTSGLCRRKADNPSDWRPVMIYASA